MNKLSFAKSFFKLRALVCFMILALIDQTARAESTASDRYCGYLQSLHAKTIEQSEKPGPIDSLLQFVNSLMQKVSLETIEKDAISKKMSFEDFQKWAKEAHSIRVADHYKPHYLGQYIQVHCGEITNSATFGGNPEPDYSSTAEKQFDPTGHPYLNQIPPPPKSKSSN